MQGSSRRTSLEGGSNNLTPEGLNSLLKRIAERPGLKKRITPYIFRHSRLTELANVLRDNQLKALAGWTAGSKMTEYYIRLAGLDLDSPLFEYYGIDKKKTPQEDRKLSPKICPRCQAVNTPNALYCESCGLALDERQAIMQALDFEEKMKKELESMKDMVFSYVKALVRTMILEDPEKARKFFSKNPDLLKEYIKKRDEDFLKEYCRIKKLDLEQFLEKETEKILNDDEHYRRFVMSIMGIDED